MYIHIVNCHMHMHTCTRKCLLSFKILSCLLDNASLLHVRSPHIFITSTKIQVFWELPPLFRPDGLIPAEISHNQLTYRPSTSAIVTPVLFSNNSLNYTLESLVPNTKYFITINVQCSKPSGLEGNPIKITARTKSAGKNFLNYLKKLVRVFG